MSNNNCEIIEHSNMKTPRGASESSTTSDNTTEFIDIVKKYDVVYNTHNPDYKNVEVKMKVWSQIAEEIGLSIDASKRKWKNLRDSYTKYLRSFRVGTKTSKKYQYWAHADHMDFLKPYQGPGRVLARVHTYRHSNGNSNSSNSHKANEDTEDTECDFGFQVLTKAATNSSSEDDLKFNAASTMPASTTAPPTPAPAPAAATMVTIPPASVCSTIANTTVTAVPSTPNPNPTPAHFQASAAVVSVPAASAAFSPNNSAAINCIAPSNSIAVTAASVAALTNCIGAPAVNATAAGALVLPVPSLPTVQLPPVQPLSKPLLGPISTMGPTNMPPAQIFPLPPLANVPKPTALMPTSSAASSVGCLIIEPQLFASADTFKKELSAPTIGLFHNITSPATTTASSTRVNPPLISKIRRVQPSPQTAAINLSFSAMQPSTNNNSTVNNSNNNNGSQPPPAKTRKTSDRAEVDISAILQANRDLDANTLFFLSLARMVRAMPTKFQSLAKMRCMRIVSDIELELENVNECGGMPSNDDSHAGKFCSIDSSPSPPDGATIIPSNPVTDGGPTEHFVYVMSPSRVESMIDISSDEDGTMNGN
ncbi:PREDICTED: rho GTPase-activating protein gacF isoform X1 [Rhagoletis zephyria]|uniref:rho GTPase-activating protein gacF isoform X1 n=2 Tax=Rhagoletis zephyria TaxID=28612 RepID=UPI00081169C9|nr:PREDICTED: rho GTPase-activating protein gacF isoform X1 [Rhagoletis zephyria]XP_017481965.1 PREDICTED: rho GTPase-activating protein gacF isoform X1 [Rhagoletis zephyria]XP_017481972.1 PREDICTED: rho GTPase-activating protein gacF isoform X1 [Rhagoletis zephyria]